MNADRREINYRKGRICLLKAPFFGNMATRMKLIDASEWCPTAATDGRNFFYNKDFVEKSIHKEIRIPIWA